MNQLLDNATKATYGFAVLFVALAFGVFGLRTAIGAATGAALGIGNWHLLRYALGRLVAARGGNAGMGGVAFLLMFKLGLNAALAFIVIRRLQVDALGFMIGFGALVMGILVASLFFSAEAAPDDDASAQGPGDGAAPPSGLPSGPTPQVAEEI